MKIRSLKNADIAGKTVLVRVDYNVPLENGKVLDDTRIRATLPTLQYLQEKGAKIVLMSHLGRPKGKVLAELSLAPIARVLGGLLSGNVQHTPEITGPAAQTAIKNLNAGDVLLLENVRFSPHEKENDDDFAKELARLGDLFVMDAFAVSHRAHASIVGVSQHLPTYAGFLMEQEVQGLSGLLSDIERPFTLIIGGAKIDTKIQLLEHFVAKADTFLIGGGIGNTFLAAKGHDVGASLYEQDQVETAQNILLEAEAFHDKIQLPVDVVVADEAKEESPFLDLPVEDVMGGMQILDVGVRTIAQFEDIIAESGTILWNGPVGLFEKKPFHRGTEAIARAIAAAKHAKTILGGGDTLEALKFFDISNDEFTHVSTGGGAMIQFLAGVELPGASVVLD